MNDLISLHDLSQDALIALLDLADRLKTENKAGIAHPLLAGKTLGMIFSKSSTRTRVSFEVGMYQLGGHALFLSSQDIQLGRGESIADTARVLSRYLDGIMIRTFNHSDVVELAAQSSIPVINALTDLLHPCQVLADLQTIREEKGRLKGLKLAYIGDGNNMANSLMHGCTKVGMDIAIATPEDFLPDTQCINNAKRSAALSGSTFSLTHDPKAAVADADVVYTDTWVSMGMESEKAQRVQQFAGFTVDQELMALARPDAIFLHCLPAYRGFEVTDEVMEGPQSRIFDEAENRLHAQKAVMLTLMGKR